MTNPEPQAPVASDVCTCPLPYKAQGTHVDSCPVVSHLFPPPSTVPTVEEIAEVMVDARTWKGAWADANEVERNDARYVAQAILALWSRPSEPVQVTQPGVGMTEADARCLARVRERHAKDASTRDIDHASHEWLTHTDRRNLLALIDLLTQRRDGEEGA